MESLVPLILFLAAAAAVPPLDIVVSASLAPVETAAAPAALTVFDASRIEALGVPFATDLLRLAPGVTVSSSGGPGAQAQVRIRGAEANHTLLFIDGIDFDDVAADDQARFETLTTDGLGRIEVVRGPQSALWGSEALGGVVALATPDPLGPLRLTGSAEYGSLDLRRTSAALVAGGADGGVSAIAAYGRSDGIDILGGGEGDRDGYENFTTSVKAVARPGELGEIGLVGRYIRHDNDYDGTDSNFLRADTADASRAETRAVRGWARIGNDPASPTASGFTLMVDGQHLASVNRNSTAGVAVNDSAGRRTRIGSGAAYRVELAGTSQRLDGRIEREDENFRTRDRQFGGGTDQQLTRGRTAFVGEWRSDWAGLLTTDLAVRHDDFNRFRDATTMRAHVILPLVAGASVVGSYGEGIAQPGFAELFGFAANSGFVGNPRLLPERSRGYEAGMRYAGGRVSAEVVAFSNRLRDEIVYSALANSRYTYVNASGTSRRRGVEASGEWRPLPGLRLNGSYTFLDAREPRLSGAAVTPQEVRRPRHSASFYGDYRTDRLTVGASLAYVGRRRDIDFDSFTPVRLDDYVLAGARIAYALTSRVEVFGRVENALGSEYQDVVGYATAGRTVHAGLRLRSGN
jgi:vitamin B12 transporter